MTGTEILLLSVLGLCLSVGFIGVLFNAFGIWLILLGAVFYGYKTHFSVLSFQFLIALGGLAILSEMMEHFLSHFGIKKMGGSSLSVLGAVVGGLIGGMAGVFLAGIGVIAGGLLGIFLGAGLIEIFRSGNWIKSFKVGMGGLFGVAGAFMVKIAIALFMIALILLRVTERYSL